MIPPGSWALIEHHKPCHPLVATGDHHHQWMHDSINNTNELFTAQLKEVEIVYYISITIVQSDTGKYHEFGAYSIITSA